MPTKSAGTNDNGPVASAIPIGSSGNELPRAVGDPHAAPYALPVDFNDFGNPHFAQFWANSDYLLWWVKGAPLPVPIVTTGDPKVGFPGLNTAGAIGQPGTTVLLGDSNENLGALSGVRFTLGGWLDSEHLLGLEGSGFLLPRRSTNFTAASNGSGSPALYFPRFNPTAGFEDALPIADPLRGYSGDVRVSSTLQLWGLEASSVWTVWRVPGIELDLLGGFRYADLRETLQIANTTTELLNGDVTTLHDFFGTHNQFYGAQAGARLTLQCNRFSFDFTGKLAMGATHEVVDIQGSTTQLGPNAIIPPGAGTFPGGFFTQPSNIGHYTGNQFTVMPALEMKVAYRVTRWMRLFAGYDVQYWNQVVRPGDQMSHSVNLSQNAVLDPGGVGVLVGPAQPGPLFNRTDFWATGLNFGAEFRF